MSDPLPPTARPARHRRPRLGGLLLVVPLVVGACSSQGAGSSGGASTASTATATSTAMPVPPATPISIPTSNDGTSPDGSGCAPPSEKVLPDGIWFGVLKSVDPAGGTIGLDLACWFTGAAAQAAAGASQPVPDDHYVRNQSSNVYVQHAVTDVAVVPLATDNGEPTGSLGPTAHGLAAAQSMLATPGPHLVWVEVTGGWVTVIQSQFTP